MYSFDGIEQSDDDLMLIRLLLLLLWSSESEAASKIFALIWRWATSLLCRAISSSSSVSGRWPIIFLLSGGSEWACSECTWARITTTSTYDLMMRHKWCWNGMHYDIYFWLSEDLYRILDVPRRLVVDLHHPVLLLQSGSHGRAPGHDLWLDDEGNTGLWLAELTWDTNSPVSAVENLSPALETTESPNPWGPRLEQARECDNDKLFLCFLNSPDFNVQSLHLKIVSFLLADFQDSVLRIYRQKLHESFLLLPFSPFSPW